MATFTEDQQFQIEIYADHSIGVQRADVVLKDNIEISRSLHRAVFQPNDDISDQPQSVQDVAAVVWADHSD